MFTPFTLKFLALMMTQFSRGEGFDGDD